MAVLEVANEYNVTLRSRKTVKYRLSICVKYHFLKKGGKLNETS